MIHNLNLTRFSFRCQLITTHAVDVTIVGELVVY